VSIEEVLLHSFLDDCPLDGNSFEVSNGRAKTDINADYWLLRCAPRLWRPYLVLMRIDRPIGIWLVLLPALQGLFLAQIGRDVTASFIMTLLVFFLGAVSVRSAACVINDIVDRKIDAQVSRTRNRPLVTGAVRVRGAMICVAALGGFSLALLAILPIAVSAWAVLAAVLIAAYPFTKRFIVWPQIFLGAVINFGVFFAGAASHIDMDWRFYVLYLANITWTLGYDTVYAYQDQKDDERIGVYSSARNITPFGVAACYTAYSFLISTVLYASSGFGLWMIFWFACVVQLTWQVVRIDRKQPAVNGALFRSNRFAGGLILAGFVVTAFTTHIS
jgi:4-hydroxybenzoate polyprenyltransferase